MRFSGDGRTLVSGSADTSVKIWNLEGHIKFTAEHADGVMSVEFAPADGKIVSASRDGTAIVWDSQLNRMRTLKGHEGPVTAAHFGGARSDTIVTASEDGTARIWLSPKQMYDWIQNRKDSFYHLTCEDERELRIPLGLCK